MGFPKLAISRTDTFSLFFFFTLAVLFGLLAVIGIIEGAITSWLVRQYQHGENSYPNSSFRDRLRFAV